MGMFVCNYSLGNWQICILDWHQTAGASTALKEAQRKNKRIRGKIAFASCVADVSDILRI